MKFHTFLKHLARRPCLNGGLAILFAAAVGTGTAEEESAAKEKKSKVRTVSLSTARTNSLEKKADPTSTLNFEFDSSMPIAMHPVRLFNLEGDSIDARLLSANGKMITVLRISDEKQFEIPMDTLDQTSIRRVEAWIEQAPEAVDFALNFEVKKRLSESDTYETLGRSLKTSKWVYDVVMTNQSRNELRDAELEYRIVYDDEVEFSRTSAYPGNGDSQQDGQSVQLPEMEFNDRAEFSTPAIEMHTYEYAPSRGDREYRRDQIVGIWIRVIRNGDVISEFQSNPAVMEKLSWDGPDEIEIEIRDSFREKFEKNGEPGEE